MAFPIAQRKELGLRCPVLHSPGRARILKVAPAQLIAVGVICDGGVESGINYLDTRCRNNPFPM